MMKKLLRIVLVLVLLIVIGVTVLYFYRNSIIRSVVESQASSSLGVKTTLGGANLGLFGGTLELSQLNVGSPQGYTSPDMFALNRLNLGVNYGDLRKKPIRVKEITINQPRAVLECVNGKFNFQTMMDQMGGGSTPSANPPTTTPPANTAPPQTPAPAPAQPASEPIKLIIDQLAIQDAQVVVRAPPLLPKDLTVSIPSITLKNIGNADGAQNGAAIKDVVAAIMSAMAGSASKSPQLKDFGQLNQLLGDQAQQVMGKVSKELQGQLENVTKNLTGDINKVIPGDVGKIIPGGGDVGKIIPGGKDPGKTIDDGLKNLIPGGKKKDDKK